MATQQNSNELRVEKNVDIEEDLKEYNIDLATVTFEASEIERALNEADAANGSDGAAATGAKVEFKDGNATNIIKRMVPISQTMETPVADLDGEKKEKIEARAEKSKADKEKGRDGIGE